MSFWRMKVEGKSELPVDWPALKAEILSKLDLASEFKALGVRFPTDPPKVNGKGIVPCHAVDREDSNPSAMISVKTGVYHDSGGSGESLSFFNFALKHGHFGRWIECLRHYAEKVGVEVPSPRYRSEGKFVEDIYDYADERGEVLYQVLRLRKPNGKKGFSQRIPDGKGGWNESSGCMDGVRRVLYRLPELLGSAHDEPIFLVEGEKDVDRLRSLGLVATCNPMGSGPEKWLDEFKIPLVNRECFVIPDNDLVGLNHAHQVCKSLQGVARCVKLVELPDLPLKGDVSDWLDAGGTVTELGRLAYKAPEWAPPPEVEPQSGLVRFANASDIRRIMSETTWIWEGWIPTEAVIGVCAFEGVGKTRFALDLCRRIHHALPWPDGSDPTLPRGSRTIWMCSDGHHKELVNSLPKFSLPDDAIWFPTSPEEPYGGVDLDDPDTLIMLEAAVKSIRPALVFVDTLTTATSRNLCDQQTMKPLKEKLKYLTEAYRVTIALLLHLAKDGGVLGRRIGGITRTRMQIECPDPEGDPKRLKLWMPKSFADKPAPLGVTMGEAGNEYDNHPPEVKQGRPSGTGKDKAARFILDALDVRDGRKVMDLLDDWRDSGGKDSTFWRARDALVDSGEVLCSGTPKTLWLTQLEEDRECFVI